MSELEIVDFSLKGGRIVQCAKRGQVVIPLNRVTIYGYGRVKFPEREELRQLRKERVKSQRAFSKFPEKQRRLDKLARKEENQRLLWHRGTAQNKAMSAFGQNSYTLSDALTFG